MVHHPGRHRCSAGAFLLATIVLVNNPDGWMGDAGRILGGILVLGTLGWFANRYAKWVSTNFVVTSDRLIYRSGVFAKNGVEIPVDKINTVFFEQKVFERLIGLGDIRVESASATGSTVFDDIPKPSAVQAIIYGVMDQKSDSSFGLVGQATADAIRDAGIGGGGGALDHGGRAAREAAPAPPERRARPTPSTRRRRRSSSARRTRRRPRPERHAYEPSSRRAPAGRSDPPADVERARLGERHDTSAEAGAGEPGAVHPGRGHQPVDERVECRGRHLEVVAQAGVGLHHQSPASTARPARSASAKVRTRWFSVTTWRARRRSSGVGEAVEVGGGGRAQRADHGLGLLRTRPGGSA